VEAAVVRHLSHARAIASTLQQKAGQARGAAAQIGLSADARIRGMGREEAELEEHAAAMREEVRRRTHTHRERERATDRQTCKQTERS